MSFKVCRDLSIASLLKSKPALLLHTLRLSSLLGSRYRLLTSPIQVSILAREWIVTLRGGLLGLASLFGCTFFLFRLHLFLSDGASMHTALRQQRFLIYNYELTAIEPSQCEMRLIDKRFATTGLI